ncbi:MAG: hypothetical protein NT048_04515 [Flavobacterium sp.]|nr:hypothetical protein [Flavobacterium sp.]
MKLKVYFFLFSLIFSIASCFSQTSSSDTDGDGTSDSEETSMGRNPNSASDFSINFDTAADATSTWTQTNSTNFVVNNGIASGTSSSGDPRLWKNSNYNFSGSSVPIIIIRIKASAASSVQIYWANEDGGLASPRFAEVSFTTTGWQELRFDLSSNTNWVGKTINSLRIDPVQRSNLNWEIDWIRSINYIDSNTCYNTVSAASSTPTLCVDTTLTEITHTTTGATEIGTPTGLPNGVNAIWASNTITISGTPTQSGTFSYSIPVTGGCNSVNATGTITVHPVFTAGAISSTGETICSGGTPSIIGSTTAASGGDNTITYSWRSSADNFTTPIEGATDASYLPPLGLTETTSYRRYAKDNTCNTIPTVATGAWTVTVTQSTSITLNPDFGPNDQTLCIGNQVIGSFIMFNTTGATDVIFTGLPAGLEASFDGGSHASIEGNVAECGIFHYTVTATGECGTTASITGTITVNACVAIVSHPTATQTICFGDAFTPITVTATGDGLTYQWYSNTTASNEEGTLLDGAQTSSYTPQSTVAGTLYYYCIVSGAFGSPVTSKVSGAFTTRATFSSGAITATGETICSGSTPSIIGSTTAASGGNTTIMYSWRSDFSNFQTAIPGANSATYTPPAGLTTTRIYKRFARDGACSTTPTASDGTWEVTITAAPNAGTLSGTQAICRNGTTTFSTNGNSGGVWTSSNTAVATVVSGTGVISGVGAGTATITYTVTGTGCNATATRIVTVTTVPNVGTLSGTQTRCTGFAFTPITVTATGVGLTYQWYSNTANSNGGGTSLLSANGAQTMSYTPQSSVAGTLYYYCIVSATCGGSAVTSTVSGAFITRANVAIDSQATATQTRCTSDAFTPITVTATGAGLTYQWYSNTANSNVGGTSLLSANGAQTSSYTPQSSVAGTLYYYCIVSGTCGSAVTSAVSGAIITNPVITRNTSGANVSICNNTSTTLTGGTVTGGSGSYTYLWESSNASGGNYAAATGTNNTANYTTATLTTTSAEVFFRRTVTSGGCTNRASAVKVTVRNAFTSGAITTTGETICSGGTPATTIGSATPASGGGGTITYSWRSSPNYDADIPLATNATYLPSAVLTTTTSYRRYAKNTICNTTPTVSSGTWTVVTITPDSIITLDTGYGPKDQTLCLGAGLNQIRFITTGATGAYVDGLPEGVEGYWADNYVYISGTPTESGIFHYTVTTTGGCGTASITGTITVMPNNTVTLDTDYGSNDQTLCLGAGLNQIRFITTGATEVNFTGLPEGLQANFDDGSNAVIEGVPTESGIFNYTVTAIGECGTEITGTITVMPNNTVTDPSDTPTVGINTVLPTITHTTTGATGIGSTTTNYDLPEGVTATWADNTITISGTPSVAGTFEYTIPLAGGYCNESAWGIIQVVPATNNSNSNNTVITSNYTVTAASSTPTVGINTPITAITHTTTGATGIGTTTTNYGLPAGVTATWANNTITISGTPSVAGIFEYAIPLAGGFGNVSATGTITVMSNNTVTDPSDTPTVGINTVLTPITHTTTGATGIGTTTTNYDLPEGVTATWADNTITISGTPSVAGFFEYTIPLAGGYGNESAWGIIQVVPAAIDNSNSDNPVITSNYTVTAASSTPTLCINTILPSITHTTSGATGIGTTTTNYGLPEGVTATWANNTITISGTPSVAGTFEYTIPLAGGFGNVSATGTITVNGYNAIISQPSTASQTLCTGNAFTPITVTATGDGLTYQWYRNTANSNGGGTLLDGAQTSSYTPQSTVAGTFYYYCIVSGTCGSAVTSAVSGAFITRANVAINSQATATRTRCIGGVFAPITVTATGAGLTYQWYRNTANSNEEGTSLGTANGAQTSSYTPQSTVAGTLYYYCIVSGTCTSVTSGVSGAIITNPNVAIGSQSTATQTQCISLAFTPITVSATGAVLTYQWYRNTTNSNVGGTSLLSANGAQTSSYTPQSTVAGTFYYYCIVSGTCGSAVRSAVSGAFITRATFTPGAITTTGETICSGGTPATTIGSTTAASGGDTQITYSWRSSPNYDADIQGATDASYLPPPGLTTTSYRRYAKDNTCNTIPTVATGAWTVTVSTSNTTITLNTDYRPKDQTLCIGAGVEGGYIDFTTTGATDVIFTGLPAGLEANFDGSLAVIEGAPTESGIFHYTVTATGECGTASITGTITVNENTASLSSVAGTDTQTVCRNTAITPINYATTGATGIETATGLPSGVTPVWASNTITISGTPTASGTFTYSIPLTGGCGTVNATGTITVTSANTASAASATPTLCINTALTAITHATTGATGIGTPIGLPDGVNAIWANDTITISGTPTAIGTFNYNIPLSGGCGGVSATGTILVSATNSWLGATSSAWNVASNWSCGLVPDSNNDIVIATSTPNAPLLNVNYTLPSGKTLTISGTGSLTIGSQSKLTIAGTADFGGKSVVMKSDANGSATLGQITGTLSNATNVTVQRYIPSGRRAPRYLTPGVTTTNFISGNWQLATHITGSRIGCCGFDQTASGKPSMYTYNNTAASDTGWTNVPSTNSTNLKAAHGYSIII